MELYYILTFLFLSFVQTDVKDVLCSLFCFLMVLTFTPFSHMLYQITKFNFYEVAFCFDLMFLLLSLIFKCKKFMPLVITLSVLLNLIGFLTPETENFYTLLNENYPTINIVLFEILIIYCLKTTYLYSWINKKLNRSNK